MICAARDCRKRFKPSSARQQFCCPACGRRAAYQRGRAQVKREAAHRRHLVETKALSGPAVSFLYGLTQNRTAWRNAR